MTFSNTSFSWVNVCSGCPVIPVKAAVAASFFSFTDAATAFPRWQLFPHSLRRGTVPHGHHTISARSQVVCRPAEVPAPPGMISAGSTSLNSFAKSALTFSNSSPALSPLQICFDLFYPLVVFHDFILSHLYRLSYKQFFHSSVTIYTKTGKEYVVATTFYILFVVLYSFRKSNCILLRIIFCI